ncbi:MAG: tyrosine-protein phosphatase [Pseudohongiellaceae bacterium]
MIKNVNRLLVCAVALLSMGSVLADEALLSSYTQLLPLEGGSNFRDMGGYTGADGKSVVKGKLFRSGAPSSLTQKDMEYLEQFDFAAVVDLRSTEELELYPNRWVQQSGVEYLNVDYSITELASSMSSPAGEQVPMDAMYRNFPSMLKPQLTLLLDTLVTEDEPVLVNCSAGQDRTGVASAVILTLLGVDRQTILADYLLSTQYRRPAVERGDVDMVEAAKTNAFAAMMLSYGAADEEPVATPLYTEDGTPFLHFALDEIETKYGSVAAYAEQELGVDAQDVLVLRAKYLE